MKISFLKFNPVFIVLGFCLVLNTACSQSQYPVSIDRKAVVQRHNVVVHAIDSLASLSVGNGKFAFTVDATGMQSFPETYHNGITLGTQSEWGWNSFENTEKYKLEESYKDFEQYGRQVSYCVQVKDPDRNKEASDWFRQNVHRLQLGNLGLEITKKDGSLATANDIKEINQTLDLWTGEIKSEFKVEGQPVTVYTAGHQDIDMVAFKIVSPLLKTSKIKVRLRFEYPTAAWGDDGINWSDEDKHSSTIISNHANQAIVAHQLYKIRYNANLNWGGNAVLKKQAAHYYVLQPGANQEEFTVGCLFSLKENGSLPDFAAVEKNSITQWEKFWKSGGAVDFSDCKDKRAFELERRVILSEYLTKVNCAGTQPPQETGLTSNSWYGKPHLEMHWWHGVHFPLWGRMDLLEQSMPWYQKVSDKARAIAKRQGFEGLRWQKMTDPDGNECPSSIGALLIWQQPHFITFSELAYRSHGNKATLDQYKKLVYETADFMASFAYFDKEKGRYMLGKGVIPAQERFKALETFNPTYELAYWKWALNVAQEWRKRDGLPRNKKWDDVMNKLSPLPVQNGVYLATESATDSYTNPEYLTDHPSVLGAFGMLPQTGMVDTTIMKSTFNKVWKDWSWPETWGWDFPMTAMSAARLNMPDKAVDALLMNIKTNTYLINGHNYQDDRLRLYLPGNGGLLTAVAMMCAGWDGSTEKNPGFPKDGNWNVRWEGLQKMP